MKDTVVFITTDAIGRGDAELGGRLMANLLRLLGEGEEVPVAVFFMNAGVRLATAGSPVLPSLERLQQRGTEVMSCQTCVEALGLQKDIAVGIVTGMADFLALASRYRVFTVA